MYARAFRSRSQPILAFSQVSSSSTPHRERMLAGFPFREEMFFLRPQFSISGLPILLLSIEIFGRIAGGEGDFMASEGMI